ncbi:MAG: hypothetical protein JNK04_19430, partial [Myxococcales bacterium]|nr:hypothetical protein [Myxococcales bacterium]
FSAAGTPFILPPALYDVARSLSPFLVYDSGIPMARAEIFEEGGYPARMKQPEATADYEEDDGLW